MFLSCKSPYTVPLRRAQSLAALVLATAGFIGAASAMAQIAAPDLHDAPILMYHRFGEDDIPATNIRLQQFEAQLAALANGGYSVLPLGEIVAAFASGSPLPEKAVAITVDDAYASFALEAWPRLKRYGFPATLFVSTDPVDQGFDRYLDWDAIRALAADGVTIGHHGAAHLHMVDAGLAEARADIERASARFREELGAVPTLFAWPYGEFSRELAGFIGTAGFAAAFGQHSGVAASWEDRFALPRFPLNERYGDQDRFALIAGARALPVDNVIPADSLLGEAVNPPAYGFSLTADVAGLRALACYPSHAPQAEIGFLDGNRVEVRVNRPFPPGRSRINCTLPGPDRRWYWLGKFFYIPGSPSD